MFFKVGDTVKIRDRNKVPYRFRGSLGKERKTERLFNNRIAVIHYIKHSRNPFKISLLGNTTSWYNQYELKLLERK